MNAQFFLFLFLRGRDNDKIIITIFCRCSSRQPSLLSVRCTSCRFTVYILLRNFLKAIGISTLTLFLCSCPSSVLLSLMIRVLELAWEISLRTVKRLTFCLPTSLKLPHLVLDLSMRILSTSCYSTCRCSKALPETGGYARIRLLFLIFHLCT